VPRTYMSTWPKDMSKGNEFFSWEAFGGDVKAALEYVRSQPQIDANRTALLGHSEGTMLSLSLSTELPKEQRPAALVLVAGPGRRTVDVLQEQLEAAVKSGRLPTSDPQKLMADYKAVSTQLLDQGTLPAKIMPELEMFFPRYATRFVRSLYGFDPAAAAARYDGPVLVLQGEKDMQISATKDTPLLAKALRARPSGSTDIVMIPTGSHCLKAAKSDTDPAFEGPVIPEALEKLVAWLKRTLRSS
jgi:uncharacterized protein